MVQSKSQHNPSQSLLFCSLKLFDPAFDFSKSFVNDLFSHFGPIQEITLVPEAPGACFFVKFCEEASVRQAIATFGEVSLKFGHMTSKCLTDEEFRSFIANVESTEPGLILETKKYHFLISLYPSFYKELIKEKLNSPIAEVMSPPLSAPMSQNNQRVTAQGARSAQNLSSKFTVSKSTQSQAELRVSGTNEAILAEFDDFLVECKQESGLLLLSTFDFDLINPKVIMTLGCCFGNVDKLIASTVSQYALLQFNNHREAHEARMSLTGTRFFGRTLSIHHFPNLILDISPKTLFKEHHLKANFGDRTVFRFQNTLKIKYNSPTNTLHFTNISSLCDQVILFMILSQINEPDKIIRLAQKGKNGSVMYLAVFASIEEATEVLSIMHNKIIEGKSIKVSFTRPIK
jgi:RNA recognition motif-containing protein